MGNFKTIRIACAILLLALMNGMAIMAQDVLTKDVNHTANMNEYLILSVIDGGEQTFTFENADHYNNGLKDANQTTIAVNSSVEWDMKMQAAGETFTKEGGGAGVPVNNLGFYLDRVGDNVQGTKYVSESGSSDAPLGMSATAIPVLTSSTADNNNNIGDNDDNKYKIYWEMGTHRGTLNSQSIFEQLRAGTFKTGTYNVAVTLTVSEKE